uniref:EF-hand domain-containing protein n=1 Tax=Palpitomonas bilix TaxID=652834 RepID=A0A7S3G9E8_9EUKA
MRELHFKLSDMGMEEPMIEALMVMLDTDGDGEIDLDEFSSRYDKFQKRLASKVEKSSTVEARGAGRKRSTAPKIHEKDVWAWKEIYDEFDADGSGSITYQELQTALASKPHLKALAGNFFKKVDADRSGTFTFAEMLRKIYPYTSASRIDAMVRLISAQHAQSTISCAPYPFFTSVEVGKCLHAYHCCACFTLTCNFKCSAHDRLSKLPSLVVICW